MKNINKSLSSIWELLGLSAILYLGFLGLVCWYAYYTEPFIRNLAYHHTFPEFFLLISIILPGLGSLLCAAVLLRKFRSREIFPQKAFSPFQVFLTMHLFVFLGVLGWTLTQNYHYRGYWLIRPGLDHRIRHARELVSITPVVATKTNDGIPTFVFDTSGFIDATKYLSVKPSFNQDAWDEWFADGLPDSHYLDDVSLYEQESRFYNYDDMSQSTTSRIFMALGEMADLSVEHWHSTYQDRHRKLTSEQLRQVYSQSLLATGLEEFPVDFIDGVVVEYRDAKKTSWLYVSIESLASNRDDRHYVYDLLFAVESDLSGWRLSIQSVRSYCDTLDWDEFYVMLPIWGVYGIGVTILLTLVVWLGHFVLWGRKRKG